MTDPIRPAVIEFFRRTACETPQDISALFSEDVDWHVAGDVDAVSWIGRKTGRKGVAEFYQAIRDLIVQNGSKSRRSWCRETGPLRWASLNPA